MALIVELHVNQADILPERLRELAREAEVEATITKPGGLGVYKAAVADVWVPRTPSIRPPDRRVHL